MAKGREKDNYLSYPVRDSNYIIINPINSDKLEQQLLLGAYCVMSFTLGYLLKWAMVYYQSKKKKPEDPIKDGSESFMMKTPVYTWVKDPRDARIYYLVDKENRVIYPSLFRNTKNKSDEPPKIDESIKNQVHLLSHKSYAVLELNRFAAYISLHPGSTQTFLNFVTKKYSTP